MENHKHDILSETDVALMVDRFYEKAFADEKLAPHFKGLDYPEHRPKMIAFWAFVLLDKPGYTTNVFDKHRHMTLDKTDFDRWLHLFNETVDQLFDGEKARDAKFRASTIAWTFAEKMKQLRST